MRHRCADDFYTPAGQRCQLLSVIAFRSGDRKEQKRERESKCEREWAPTTREYEHCEWVESSWFFWRLAFPEWAKLKAFCIEGLSACVCVHVCACLCLSVFGFSPPLLLPLPSCICRRSSLAHALFCPTFSWRTASCALCSVLSYRPSDHIVMT